MNNVQSKREREKRMVSQMIALYCRKQHSSPKGGLCPECEALTAYAMQRSDRCPFTHAQLMQQDGIYRSFVGERREASSWKVNKTMVAST